MRLETQPNDKYRIRIHGIFESAHYLYNYYPDGSDEELHGHTWEAEVFLDSHRLNNGISVDFLDIRKAFDQLMIDLDHVCLNEIEPFDKVNPTAENLANYIYQHIKGEIAQGAICHEVRVWEGPKNYASYFPGA